MSHDWPALGDGEVELTAGDEVLLRQVAPTYLVHDGTTSVDAFKPMTRDQGLLSMRRSTLMTPKEAFEERIASGLDSAGTLGVSVDEVHETGLRAIDDSAVDDNPPAHASIDFRPLDRRERKSAASTLGMHADVRGWLHRPADR